MRKEYIFPRDKFTFDAQVSMYHEMEVIKFKFIFGLNDVLSLIFLNAIEYYICNGPSNPIIYVDFRLRVLLSVL